MSYLSKNKKYEILIMYRRKSYKPIRISISFDAILLWYEMKSEKGASLLSDIGNEMSGILVNVLIAMDFLRLKRF